MTGQSPESRRRWINIGEIVAVAGLLISGLALWNSWRGDDKPAAVVEERRPIPLALRGSVEDEGKAIRIAPVEEGHALDGLTIAAAAPAKGSAPYGSEPMLSAATIESWLPDTVTREGNGALTVTISARYIEMGETRSATQRYRVAFTWKEGGLFGGKALRLTGISRS